MKLVVFLVFALLGWSDALGIDTVPTLNVTQYLGRWYQVFKQSFNTHYCAVCKSRYCDVMQDRSHTWFKYNIPILRILKKWVK